ncbi:hypothetical protein AB0I51_33750 [Streptomyces sp. NPDC050549]|uniref:hypothetical protein n=1 Tax=Streptomyces sp. NPDC050549 TaxID=3155406 RepID=UPI00342F02B1
MDKNLETTRQKRLRLVTAAIGWGRSDSEIATRARVPRRAAYELRDTVAAARRRTTARRAHRAARTVALASSAIGTLP